MFPGAAGMGSVKTGGTAEWLGKAARRAGGARSLLAAAVSTDGAYLAVGGGDRKVHVWDVRSRQYVQVKARLLVFASISPEKSRCSYKLSLCTCYASLPMPDTSIPLGQTIMA